MNASDKNADLRARLLALGFDVVRFARIKSGKWHGLPARDSEMRETECARLKSARAGSPCHGNLTGWQPVPRQPSAPVAALRSWLDDGFHADMDWIERGFEKRRNPDLVLPCAKSVILLGVNYNPVSEKRASVVAQAASLHDCLNAVDTKAGWQPALRRFASSEYNSLHWARYARYADYHDTLKPALVRVGRVLETSLGITADDYRYYTDTGPVLERAWAARAGLGFIGKNAMLISRDYGNWLFLAEIFVRAEISPDEPEPLASGHRLCGKCTRCMDACPTGAIVRAGVVDSRLCISYHTIENKGIIPRELRPKIGARIYGCDVCAEMCPWNRFAQESRGALLDARPELAQLSLRDVLTLTPEKFATVFQKTAIKRIKLPALLRNACVVAGNLGDCLEEVVALTGHASPLVRVHAVWAVFKIAGRERAAKLLREKQAAETDADVLREYAISSGMGCQPM